MCVCVFVCVDCAAALSLSREVFSPRLLDSAYLLLAQYGVVEMRGQIFAYLFVWLVQLP